MLQSENNDHIVATQSLVRKLDVGLLFDDMEELGRLMRNKKLMTCLRDNAWKKRHLFMFDYHVEDLVKFFREVIKNFKNNGNTPPDNTEPMFAPVHQKALTDKTYHSQPQPF
jgi:hypothetical protein